MFGRSDFAGRTNICQYGHGWRTVSMTLILIGSAVLLSFSMLPKLSHASDPCAPKISPEGLDYTLPCSMDDVSAPELTPRVYFEPNSAELDKSAKANLNSKIEILKWHPKVVLNLKGFADTTEAPRPKDRAKLGLARARSVEAYLAEQGINSERLAAAGASHVMIIPKANDPSSLARMRFVIIEVEIP